MVVWDAKSYLVRVRSMGSMERQKDGHSGGVAIQDFQELAHDGDRLEAECLHDVDKLDRAQVPFPTLVLGDERLRLVEARGNIRLGQPALLATVAQQLAELDLARRAQRVAHCGKPRSKMKASLHNPDFGLSHFGIYL